MVGLYLAWAFIAGPTIEITPAQPQALLPASIVAHDARNPRLTVAAVRAKKLGRAEEVALEARANNEFHGSYTFRGDGPYILELTSGEVTVQRRVIVQPKSWVFRAEFMWFSAGIVLVAGLVFGLDHLARRRAARRHKS